MIYKVYRKGNRLYMASTDRKDGPVGDYVLDDEGLHLSHGYIGNDEAVEADESECIEFNRAVAVAGMIFYEGYFHTYPCESDWAILEKVAHMPYTRWPEKSAMALQCAGTYAKEVIRRICISDNHREEASVGEI